MEIHTNGRRNGPSVAEIVIAFLILALVCTLIVTIMGGFVDNANQRALSAEAMAIVIAARSAAMTLQRRMMLLFTAGLRRSR